MFRDLSALPSCSETIERQTEREEEGVYIHSHFAVGLFPYLFKHAPVNYLSGWAPALCTCTASIKHLTHAFTSPRWKCTLGRRADKKGTHQSRDFLLRGKGKTTLLTAKQMQRSLVNLGSKSRGCDCPWIIDELSKWITRRSTCCTLATLAAYLPVW